MQVVGLPRVASQQREAVVFLMVLHPLPLKQMIMKCILFLSDMLSARQSIQVTGTDVEYWTPEDTDTIVVKNSGDNMRVFDITISTFTPENRIC